MARKVFIVSNGGHDYSAAAEFGEIVFCTDGYIRKDDIHQMYTALSSALKDADADDYIMMGSLTSMCSIAVGIMADRFGEVNLLIHSGEGYVYRHLVFESRQ